MCFSHSKRKNNEVILNSKLSDLLQTKYDLSIVFNLHGLIQYILTFKERKRATLRGRGNKLIFLEYKPTQEDELSMEGSGNDGKRYKLIIVDNPSSISLISLGLIFIGNLMIHDGKQFVPVSTIGLKP